MSAVEELINKMKVKPGMYFSNYSVYCVKSFLDGFSFEKKQEKLLMTEFQNFVVEKFNISPVLSWDQIIRLYSKSDFDSMHSFFKIFDEFIKSRPN